MACLSRYAHRIVNRRPKLEVVAPGASAEETAAVVAALERFIRDTSVATTTGVGEDAFTGSQWKRAALAEGIRRAPELLASWE
jgi:hypothetical protein